MANLSHYHNLASEYKIAKETHLEKYRKKIVNMEIRLSQVEKCLICIQILFLLPLPLFPK